MTSGHPHSRLARALLALEDFSRRHHRLVILLAVGVLLVGTVLSSTLRLETDILELLPQDDPAVVAFRDTARVFGALDTFPIMIDAPEGFEAEDYEDLADRLTARLARDPVVAAVDARVELDSPFVRYCLERLPLFLDRGGLDSLESALADESIRSTVADNRVALSLPTGEELKKLLQVDPLRLSGLLLAQAGGRGDAEGGSFGAGYTTSPDGRAILLLLRPARPAQDVHASADLVRRVRAHVAQALAEARRADPELPEPRILLGGRYVISVEDSSLILADIGKTMSLAFLGVVALYLFCYRRLAAVLYSALPLMIGQVLTFALARIAWGSLNSATATSAALLMGLGTDFTIVMYARYVEERRAGRTVDEASRVMMGEAALGVYTGAITSAGTFGALMLTAFVGLRQFGFMVGSGILLCLVSILILLPALVVAFEGRERAKPPTLYVHSFGFERLILVSRRWPRATLAACLLVSAAALPLALKLKLADSVKELRSPNNAGILAQEEIGLRFGRDENFLMVMVRGRDEAEAGSKARAVEQALRRRMAAGELTRVEGLGALLPDAASQEAARARLESGAPSFDPDRVEATLRGALVEQGFRATAFDGAIETLRAALRPTDRVTAEGLRQAGGGDLVGRFLRRDGDGAAAVSYVFGTLTPAAMDELRAIDPGVSVAGVSLLSQSLKKTIRRDVTLCLGVGFVIVAILLAMDFGSWVLSGLALAQLSFGLLWMLGAMKVFGIPLTMVNSFAAALLLGVGIDYGIHVVHRLQGPDKGDEAAVLETGKAVAVAAMTNVVGFGVLMASNYPGLRGLGAAAVLGSLGCMLSAFTLLPALERLLNRDRPPGRSVT